MNEITRYLNNIVLGNNLTSEEIMRVIQIISYNGATPAQIAAFVMGISTKGESSHEIIGLAEILKQKFQKKINMADISDYLLLINSDRNYSDLKSFVTSLIIASSGYKVLNILDNIDNQSIIDDFADIGIKYQYQKTIIEESIEKINLGMIIPNHFDFLSVDLVATLDELRIPNIFDSIKPLMYRFNNNVSQIIKLSSHAQVEIYTQIFKILNTGRVWLVYNDAKESLCSLIEMNQVILIDNGFVSKFKIDLKDFIKDEQTNLNRYTSFNIFQLLKFLDDDEIYDKNSIIIDAAMCIYLLADYKDIKQAVDIVKEIISSKKAKSVLKELVEINNNHLIT